MFLHIKFVKYEDFNELHTESVADFRNNGCYIPKLTLEANFIITGTGACSSPAILLFVLTLHNAQGSNNLKEIIRLKVSN
jgi:hypothetical protein